MRPHNYINSILIIKNDSNMKTYTKYLIAVMMLLFIGVNCSAKSVKVVRAVHFENGVLYVQNGPDSAQIYVENVDGEVTGEECQCNITVNVDWIRIWGVEELPGIGTYVLKSGGSFNVYIDANANRVDRTGQVIITTPNGVKTITINQGH